MLFRSKYEKLPVTPTAITGGGGKHIFFQHPGFDIRNSAGKLGKGLDFRGDGGYVVVSPSIHPSGNPYKWELPPSKTPLAPMPQWLIDLSISEEQPKQTNEDAFSVGKRNQTLTSLAGTMRRRGMSEKAIYTALLEENKIKCSPPLKNSEVLIIAQSVVKYDPSAAPETKDKTRMVIEWSLAKSIFEYPVDLKDISWLTPDYFDDKTLQVFLKHMIAGDTTTSAATKAEILSELQEYENFDSTRIDYYAEELRKFKHYNDVNYYAEMLSRAAREHDQIRIDKTVLEISKNVSLQSVHRVTSVTDLSDEVESDIKKRAENPGDVWGIPYAFPYLTQVTGGKQLGELIILAGEPKLGKSFWVMQDALETAIKGTPVFIWSGEMKRKQVMRRLYQLYGLNSRRSKTGYMQKSDWDILAEAKSKIQNSPLYIDDNPLKLNDLRGILMHEKAEHGIQQFVIDYAMLVSAPGKDEIERSANVSTEMKKICSELNLSGILIASVNKQGMDTTSENYTKSNVRGSGQQIHDADIVYLLTKYCKSNSEYDLFIKPNQYDNIVMLHIAAGRELDHHLPNGIIHYERDGESPKFVELKKPENVTTFTPNRFGKDV